MPLHRLPPQLHVFVRDWLSANNILLKSRDGHVLIDTGFGRHAPLTLALLGSPRGLGDQPLAWLVNTHCHSDHIGGNAAVARKYGCPIAVPEGEAPLIDRWDQRALLLSYADQTAERFRVDRALVAGATHVWGDMEWRLVAAPGHDMSALVFYNPEHGILISGDALWQHGFGLVMPPEIDPAALPATRATLETIAGLGVRVVIPGHGEPFVDVASALDRAMRRVEAFEADPMRMVRHALKALLTFTLLDRQRLSLADLPAYVDRIGIYREFNDKFFHLTPADLAAWLVADLEKAGAARRDGEFLRPA
ncbi:MAG: MBL fold metallo-hydrolase [Aromatoleum sp.]|nr:MBL fold metallo-hydrolase [Aromatoleum sp.]